jgi:hypothetical protein
MSIVIDPSGLCPKCRLDHELLEEKAGRKLPVAPEEMCTPCKDKFGLGREKGDSDMKKKRKYTRSGKYSKANQSPDTLPAGPKRMLKTAKPAKLDKDTKKFIKNLLKSGKKAEKFEARAEKIEAKAAVLREKAAIMRETMEAVKNAVQVCG